MQDFPKPLTCHFRFVAAVLLLSCCYAAGEEAGPATATIAAPAAAGVSEPAAARAETARERAARLPDRNEDIFYRNKFEVSQEFGVLPINIPFVFDVFLNDDYSQKPLHYTMAPVFTSVRWQMGKPSGPGPLRGNFDFVATMNNTPILRGPETFYQGLILGFRRNFIPRNWRATPYFESRVGVGTIDAKEPHGVRYAQGQDTTFTLLMGAGTRYNFNAKYSMAVGIEYMHISNLYLSEPKYTNNGINVYGPMIGFNMELGSRKRR